MKYFKLSFILVGAALLVAGCSAINKLDKSDEYKKTKPHDKPLVLPSVLDNSSIENHYPVPRVDDAGQVVSTLPPR